MTAPPDAARRTRRSRSDRGARRSRRNRLHTPANPRQSLTLTLVTGLFVAYCLIPLAWLAINATKTQADFVSTFGFEFGGSFALWDNIVQVFTYQDGIYGRWVLNTIIYVVVGAVVSTWLAAMGGYALARLNFSGKRTFLFVVLGSIAVPGIVLAIPQFLLFARMGITDTPWAILIPSFINPFGLYLMWVFSAQAVPWDLLEAAKIDGAGEFRIFHQVALPLLGPALVTVTLFSFVAIWNNYFLPLIMLRDPDWFPLTLGINQWNSLGQTAGDGDLVQNLVITASFLTIVPLIIAFLMLQRYWQSGLSVGAVKG